MKLRNTFYYIAVCTNKQEVTWGLLKRWWCLCKAEKEDYHKVRCLLLQLHVIMTVWASKTIRYWKKHYSSFCTT